MSSNSDAISDFANLFNTIDKQKLHGLNLSVPESVKGIFKPWDEREDTTQFAESGVDDQLIIHVPFLESVRIKSILLKIGRGESAPQHLNIYANHPTIVDFADAESMTPQLSIALQTGEPGVIEYPLRVATLAMKDSEGGETSRIYYIGFKGDLRSARAPASSGLEVPVAGTGDAKLVDRARSKAGAAPRTTAR